MAVIRQEELSGLFSCKTLPQAVLVYGSEEALVGNVIHGLAEAARKRGEVIRFSGEQLRQDGAALDEALRSKSFFADGTTVFVSGSGDGLVSTLQAALTGGGLNPLVLSAGNLSKTSALRQMFETGGGFLCCPIYEESAGVVLARAEQRLKDLGLVLEAEARSVFLQMWGSEPAFLMSEAEKLALYCHGQTSVSAEDVAACGGQAVTGEETVLLDAALGGDVVGVEGLCQKMEEAELKASLFILLAQLATLANLRAEADRSGSVEGAIRTARPPVFFRRQPVLARQLKIWALPALLEAQMDLERTQLESRQRPDVSRNLVERLFFRLASEARRRGG
ncbi:MAG: hypothetical protein U1E15_01015 [Hyphomicrobiales bacterium]